MFIFLNYRVDFENDDPIELKLQQAINAVSLKELGGENATLRNTWQEGHCITATVHERKYQICLINS